MQERNDTVGAKLDAALKVYANKNASVEELERAVSSLPVVIVAAQGACDALLGRRRETLLSGSDADRRKLQDGIDAAKLRLEQLVALAEELDARLVQAREAATDAARARLRGELLGKRDRMAARLLAEYPKAARAIADLIEESARLEIEIEDFNKAAPADEGLQSPEYFVRHRVAEPRQEIRRSIEWLWCREGDAFPILAEHQGAVKDHGDGRGAWLSGNTAGGSYPCVRRKFERVEFYPAQRITHFEALAQGVNLPGFLASDPDFWLAAKNQLHPHSWISHAERLREAASARSAQAQNRRVETELRLINDNVPRGVKIA